MLQRLFAYFARHKLLRPTYSHPELGPFEFVSGIGWTKMIDLDGQPVQLYLGSDGQSPNPFMLECLNYWTTNWANRRSELNDFITHECRLWISSETAPQPNQLQLSSIQILWPEKPWSCMIYLSQPDDEERAFHLTFDGPNPIDFAYEH